MTMFDKCCQFLRGEVADGPADSGLPTEFYEFVVVTLERTMSYAAVADLFGQCCRAEGIKGKTNTQGKFECHETGAPRHEEQASQIESGLCQRPENEPEDE